jgi:microcystin-dependent protein
VNTNAAHNGANSDITSLNGLTTPIPITEGGTGASTAAQALINLGVIAALAAIVTVPIGGVIDWTTTAPPTNFLECNGQAISRTTYATLFGVCGTTFGAGDGATTFNIPDLRGYFVRGWANTSSEDSGRVFGSVQTNTVGPHTHPLTDPGHTHALPLFVSSIGGAGSGAVGEGGSTINSASATTGITISANTGTTESRPDNVALMKIIRVM